MNRLQKLLVALLVAVVALAACTHPSSSPTDAGQSDTHHPFGAGHPATFTVLSGVKTWTPPPGVFFAFLTGCGGGGGGGGGYPGATGTAIQYVGGSGGGGAPIIVNYPLAVTPGTALDFAVGAGGTGGAASSNGSDGGLSTVVLHIGGTQVFVFPGGGKGLKGTGVSSSNYWATIPGGTVAGAGGPVAVGGMTNTLGPGQALMMGMGGWANSGTNVNVNLTNSTAGGISLIGAAGGTAGAQGTTVTNLGAAGGGGGGAALGHGGAGGAGGSGVASGTGNAGTGGQNPAGSVTTAASTTNTCAGGGGGGAGGNGSTAGGNGAAGGGGDNGKITVIWFE